MMDVSFLENKIDSCKLKIGEIESQIELLRTDRDRLKSYLSGLEDALWLLQADPQIKLPESEIISPQTVSVPVIKRGSEIAKIYQFIKEAKKPLHVREIAKLLREEGRQKESSLAGNLSTYAKNGKIFKRAAPNTFGLIEINYNQEVQKND